MEKSKLHTSEEILNALHVIQDTCEYYLHGNDEDCEQFKIFVLLTKIVVVVVVNVRF